MENEHLIPADKFCAHYNVEFSFINTLQKLEQYTRWHYDLDINIEGIEVIEHLLNRMRNLQDEIISLQNRLRIFEENSRRIFLNQPDE